MRWIRGFAKIVKEKLNTTEVPSEVKDVAILEMDELFTYYQKKSQKAYVWLAVDRDRNVVIDIVVSTRRSKDIFIRMSQRLERLGYKGEH